MRRAWWILGLVACGDAETGAEAPPAEAEFVVTVSNTAATDALVASDGTTVEVAFSPGVFTVRNPDGDGIFAPGREATAGEERLAESGQVRDLLRELAQTVENRGTFGGDSESSYGDQPVMPGDEVLFGFRAVDGQVLSMATMFGESNDTVAAALDHPLFESGQPFEGTISVVYVDAGTEENEELGVGPNQGPRQSEADQGEPEGVPMVAFETTDAQGFQFPVLGASLTVEIAATPIAPE